MSAARHTYMLYLRTVTGRVPAGGGGSFRTKTRQCVITCEMIRPSRLAHDFGEIFHAGNSD
jgi:hypothetical protein